MLSDSKKRTMYDAGLYDPQEEEDEVSVFQRHLLCGFKFGCF